MAEYSTFNKVHIFNPDGGEETRKIEVDAKNVVVPEGHPGGKDEPSRDDYETGATDLATELGWLKNTTLTYDNLDESYFVFKAIAGNPAVKKWQIESSQLISIERLSELVAEDRNAITNPNRINVAPVNHASANNIYGTGDFEKYGHVKVAHVDIGSSSDPYSEVDKLKNLSDNKFNLEDFGTNKTISSNHILDAGTISLLYQKILNDKSTIETKISKLEAQAQEFPTLAEYKTWYEGNPSSITKYVTCFIVDASEEPQNSGS